MKKNPAHRLNPGELLFIAFIALNFMFNATLITARVVVPAIKIACNDYFLDPNIRITPARPLVGPTVTW